MTNWNVSLLAPEIVLSVCALLIMLLDPPLRRKRLAGFSESVALVGFLGALFLGLMRIGLPVDSSFGGFLIADALSTYLHILFAVIGLSVLIMSIPWLRRDGVRQTEFLVLLIFAVIGMMIMSCSAEMVTMFIGLELLSLPLYVLAGYLRNRERTIEASLKYFLLGAFASALLLMGIALQWGTYGTLHLSSVAPGSGAAPLSLPLAAAGFWLVVVGLGFKVSAVPFHFWTADVYEGSPTPVTALMSTGTKAAAMAVLLRLMSAGFAPAAIEWMPVLWWLAVLTMSVGNLMALVQANIKRMLAFSGIAHAGYLLLAICAGGTAGNAALLFYLAGYTVMNLGAFAIVGLLEGKGERFQSIYDYSGLAKRNPWLAAMMTIFLLSLAGIPATVGFMGKFFIFTETLKAGHIGLVVIALLNSLVSVYYYLRVIYLMYMKDEWGEKPVCRVPASVGILLAFTTLVTLWLGVAPNRLLDALMAAARIF
ncbi:MAG: NADH-quinone oxidoreductase subunit N [bacterium]|nr:NADH-quinone oxidoreductase subunit N [bacterium]